MNATDSSPASDISVHDDAPSQDTGTTALPTAAATATGPASGDDSGQRGAGDAEAGDAEAGDTGDAGGAGSRRRRRRGGRRNAAGREEAGEGAAAAGAPAQAAAGSTGTGASPVPDTCSGSGSARGSADGPARGKGPGSRGGRQADGGRRSADAAARPDARPARDTHPLLEHLAGLYPRLFGADFLPLKRGIFHDLRERHPEALAADALKEALGRHTRSTRYLQSVAAARPRHDLDGRPVEPLASDHVYQALIELWRRRSHRTPESGQPALRDQWRLRLVQAFEASGLPRDVYADKMRSRDEAANALLDEALAEAATRAARDEALLRAFEAGSTTVEAFADMYGLEARHAARVLEAARRRRKAAAVPAAGSPQDTAADDTAPDETAASSPATQTPDAPVAADSPAATTEQGTDRADGTAADAAGEASGPAAAPPAP